MTGGLIQLATVGKQDSPLIANPDITFFKTVYKRYTNFTLYQNNKFLENKNFGSKGIKKLETNGDLLYNLYFKLEIPYFELNKVINNYIINEKYDINFLEVNYMNNNCIVIFVKNNGWYIIPEYLFRISNFNYTIKNVNSIDLQPKLLPDYIKISNLGQLIKYYDIIDNPISTVISLLYKKSNFWEQYFLNIISNMNNIQFINKIQTLKSIYINLNDKIKIFLYNLYYKLYFFKNNNKYFNFILNNKTETERYLEYNNLLNITDNNKYDIDVVYNYCKQNSLLFTNYKDNILPYNSLIILFMLNMLYSSNDILMTFWKKYSTTYNNNINNNIIINNNNLENEWTDNIKLYLSKYCGVINIKNQIFDNFNKLYIFTFQEIINEFNLFTLKDPIYIYTQLKTIISRFYKIPNNQLNFNNYFLATKYPDINYELYYNSDNYNYVYNIEENKYPKLNKLPNKLSSDEMSNLTFVNLQNIYSIIANDLINTLISSLNLNNGMISFLILWRNIINIRLYKQHIDYYNNISNNSKIKNIGNERELTLFYSITPCNLFLLNDFKNSFYEMFYKNSFIGSLNINSNNLYKLLETIYNVKNNLLNSTLDIPKQNFYNLTITNNYNINTIIYFSKNNKMLIKYNNYYDTNSIISLIYKDKIINSQIQYEFYNNILYLAFYDINISFISNNQILINKNNYNYINYVNDINNNLIITLNDSIELNVTFNINLPIMLFYNNNTNLNYTNFNINKFILLNNFLNINNIDNDNNILIPDYIYSSNKIKLLVIEYFTNNDIIISPESNFTLNIYSNNINNNIINNGKHLYCISYCIDDIESQVSLPLEINLGDNQFIKINNIPISNNINVNKRKIYRTKSNDNTFYLLSIIDDNITTFFIDNINDSNLGIELQTVTTNIINNLPSIDNNILKIPIYIKKLNNNKYYITDYENKKYIIDNNLNKYKQIYIEILDSNYDYLDNNKFNLINNKIVLTNYLDYSSDYLYYLVNKTNLRDTIKLIPDKKKTAFNYLMKLSTNLNIGTYLYKFSLFDTVNNNESILSCSYRINNNNNNTINITNNTNFTSFLYNSIKIYRTKDITNNNDNIIYYQLDIINNISNFNYIDIKNDNLLIDHINIPLSDYKINISYENNGNVDIGIHNYIFIYYNSITLKKSLPSNTYSINLLQPSKVIFNIPNNIYIDYDKVLIYRTKSNNINDYYYIDTISISVNVFNDIINDENLNIKLNNPFSLEPDDFNITESIIYYYKYYYAYYFYNSINHNQSILYFSIIDINNYNNDIFINNLNNINNYDKIYIYRSYITNNYYYIDTVNLSSNTLYIDNKKNFELNNPLFIPYNNLNLDLTFTLINNGNIHKGIYNYKFIYKKNNINFIPLIYFNNITNINQNNDYSFTITLLSNQNIIINNIPLYTNYTCYLYRTKLNNNNYYLVDIINNNYYNDNKNDNILGELLQNNLNYSLLNNNPNIDIGTYYYKFIYYNSNYKTFETLEYKIIINQLSNIQIYIPQYNNLNINIYRTKLDDIHKFYYVGTINSQTTYFIDNIPNINLSNILNSNMISYSIIIGGNNINFGKYNYKLLYYNDENNITGLNSNILNISYDYNINNHNIIINDIPIYHNYNKIKLYRTFINSINNYYYVNTHDINSTIILDNINDNNLGLSLMPINFIPISNGNLSPGIYNYKIIYYNSINNNKSVDTQSFSVTLSENSNINITNINIYNNFDSIILYRTKVNKNIFYYVKTYNNNNNLIIDDINDNDLNILLDNNDYNIIIHSYYIYKYKISFYNKLNNIESIPSDEIIINIIDDINITPITITNLPIINDNTYDGRKIYRTKKNNVNFYLLDIINESKLSFYIDNKSDEQLQDLLLNKSEFTLVNNISNITNYKILKMPINNIVPNLHSFISHSTDYNYINSKNISDLNDYIFNKPFIMLFNNSSNNIFKTNQIYSLKNTFNTGYLYFYNINFKINSNSIIKLNNIIVQYLLPISTQQFFIKDTNYYEYDNINKVTNIVSDNNIIQNTFNPSFDEFNLDKTFFISNNSLDTFINNIIYKLDFIINNNIDYYNIIKLLNNTNNKYINLFKTIFNNSTLYGNTSNIILNNIDLLNNNLSLLNFNNNDYLNYSHYAIDFSNINELNKINNSLLYILSPIYNSYNANNKISINLSNYLNNISSLFINHINYINDNISYIKYSESNNYKEQFISYSEIQQNIQYKFNNYSSTNIINLLFPILTNNIYQLIFNDNIINNSDINLVSDNNITINKNINNILENKYFNTKINQYNNNLFRNDKFNYLGLIHYKNKNILYNNIYNQDLSSFYIKFDDNTIYKINYDNNLNQINNNYLINCIVKNPYKITFNKVISAFNLLKTNFNYIYKINLICNNIKNIVTNFFINNNIIYGKIINNYLYLYTNLIFNKIDINYLLYQNIINDYTTWKYFIITN